MLDHHGSEMALGDQRGVRLFGSRGAPNVCARCRGCPVSASNYLTIFALRNWRQVEVAGAHELFRRYFSQGRKGQGACGCL